MPWATSPEENERILNQTASHPRMMIASDGVYNIPHPHPRSYGCFVQYLGKFVRERQLISLKRSDLQDEWFPCRTFPNFSTAVASVKDSPRISSFSIQIPSQINPHGLIRCNRLSV